MDKSPRPVRRDKGLRARLQEAEERAARFEEAHKALQAVSRGEVDAVIVPTGEGDRVFTLQGADRSYQVLVEAMAEGVATVTKEGLILYANRAFSRMMGIPLEKVIGASIIDFVIESDKARFRGLLEGRARTVGRKISLLTAEGAALPVSISTSPLPESDPPAFCLVVTDLTEWKKAEAELERYWRHLEELVSERTAELAEAKTRMEDLLVRERTARMDAEEAIHRSRQDLEEHVRERTAELVKANATLREAARTLEELVQASPAGIFVLDPEGKVLLWNPAMEQILGWTEEEVRGKLVPTVAAGQEGAREILMRLRAGETLAGIETRRVRKDGEPVDLRLWTAPIRDGDGSLRRIVEIVADVTKLKELERIALVQEKMASLGHMASGIAHEIRNPLSGLNVCLSSLEKVVVQSARLEPEVRESVRKILGMTFSASDRIDGTVRRILDFSRSEPLRRQPLPINACIREAVALVQVVLGKSRIRFKLALEEVLPECLGDRRLIEQVFLNLLTNAVNAVEGTVGEKVIEASSFPRNGYVHLAVADSGLGVPEGLREKIFESFFTTRPEGTGIGLTLSRKIVSDHGGFIRVGTSRWGGALFTVGLPAEHERKRQRKRPAA